MSEANVADPSRGEATGRHREIAEKYPAPGFRDSGGRGSRAGGTLWLVGNAGYIWSSAIPTGSGNAHHLNLYYGGIYPQYYNYRAYGFPLRCLQE